jgi:hypothetical protein
MLPTPTNQTKSKRGISFSTNDYYEVGTVLKDGGSHLIVIACFLSRSSSGETCYTTYVNKLSQEEENVYEIMNS